MGWGTNLLNGILGALFGDDKDNEDAKFGYSRPCGHTRPNNFRSDPLEDDIPEGHYTRVNKDNQYSQNNRKTQDYYSKKTNYTKSNTKDNNSSTKDYYSNDNYFKRSNNTDYNNSYRNTNKTDTDDKNDSVKYYDFNEYNRTGHFTADSKNYNSSNNTWDKYSNQNIKKDKTASASQGFRRQHATRSKDGTYTYPTLSSKSSKTVKNDKASFTFGEPHFSTYDHGIRGIAFPYSLKINDPFNRKIVVSGKFCNSSGAWIKSLVPDMSDRYGDLVINESVFCTENSFHVDSYLFVPYGVLALKQTQKVYLNIDVFVDGSGPQHLLRYVFGFEYYVYENDPREPETSSTMSNKQAGFDELIGLVAHVIKADGVCAPEEIRAVIDYFKKFNTVDKDYLRERLKYKLSNPSNLESDCEILKKSFNTQTRLTFLALFFKIAVSDDSIPSVEMDLIKKISNLIGIPETSYNSISEQFLPVSDRVWHLFGLTSKATKDQLKKAYREKCKECHPDRFANASKEEYKRAEEKFKELQDFYDFLLRRI